MARLARVFQHERLALIPVLLTALSDSGMSDWIQLANSTRDSVNGPVRVSHGSEVVTADLRLAHEQIVDLSIGADAGLHAEELDGKLLDGTVKNRISEISDRIHHAAV